MQGVADKYEAAKCRVAGLEPGQRLVPHDPLLLLIFPVGEPAALLKTHDCITQHRHPQQLRCGQALWRQDCRQPLLGHTLVIQNVPAFTNPLTGR